jgi:hypothetical protein
MARLDPGDVPRFNVNNHPLPPLTYLESKIVSPARLHMQLMVLRLPGQEWRPSDTLQQGLRGHTLAFQNPSPDQLCHVIPYDPSRLPSIVTVRTPQLERLLPVCTAMPLQLQHVIFPPHAGGPH